MKKRLAIAAVLLCALGAAAAVYFNNAQTVQTAAATSHVFTTFLEGSGAVDAPKQTILAPLNGHVKALDAAQGQRVCAGDIVLQMDDTALELQLQQAVETLNAQKKAWQQRNDALSHAQKQSSLWAAQAVGSDLEQFNATQTDQSAPVGPEQVNVARLQVEQAQDQLDNASVRSVIDGEVLEVDVRPGELVAQGTVTALVADMDHTQVQAVFADQDAATVSPGMEVELYGGCLGDQTVSGTVTEIKPRSETVATATGTRTTATVTIAPEAGVRLSRLGATVNLRIVTGRKSALGVPLEALAQDSSGLYVFVIRGNRAYKATVKVGELDDTCAEITSGIRSGDIVALNPGDLHHRQKVSAR